ncbi:MULTISPECIES: IS66 family insertion sequence element accessory protein TnpB [Bacteroidales]|jgi:transposase|uniref:IS66 family insertion sequence element accessory protein TnpB n=1 Tax=Bacteroides difficilis TaxID=2763021 RepID=A0ABR7CHH6_9BACE|nr:MULTISPECIES: IS66 family insertion sequence element accessory protein TnpB [Bacteroidales]MBC5607255.1 IS66 family insertion sequence element accessory protein TnpB [Bacteroides difficilis]MCG0162328.1 IS66 family insertion sequence element accessory protein TnpB [Phocaeicola vulgatus]MCR0977372.1 IS66 family insertion sequence element accessory protein TnpB [Parabacteroides merdae]MCR0978177.1 IS66 family insertion sequence element accessory protein TnpB [Parabacteroides merdae]MDB8918943
MFELSENNRYFFFPEPVRMSYGIDGLSKLVYTHPALSLVSGDIFVFFSHDRKRIKLLRWDGDGFILYYKRLTRGTFDLPRYSTEKGVYELDWYTFYFIMRGITAQELRFKKRFRIACSN